MKLSEYRDEKAVELLGRLIEPITMISTNEELQAETAKMTELREDANIPEREKQRISARLAGLILQKEPKAIKDAIAIINGKDPDSYEANFAEIMRGVVEIMKDPDLKSLFF